MTTPTPGQGQPEQSPWGAPPPQSPPQSPPPPSPAWPQPPAQQPFPQQPFPQQPFPEQQYPQQAYPQHQSYPEQPYPPGPYPPQPAPVSGMPQGPVSGMPHDPGSGMPHGPMSGMPQGPVSAMPQGPVSGMPPGPASGVPGPPYPPSGYGPPVVGGPPQSTGSPTAVVATLAALGVLLVLALGGVAFLLVGGDGEPSATPGGTPSASPTPSATPSPTPEESPSETSSTEDRLSHTEYDDDWKFKLGDVKLSAEYVDGWDYEDCEDVEVGGALTDLGCEYGIEVTYQAEGGKLVLSHLILGMSDEDAAEDAVDEVKDDDFELHKKSYLADFSYGKWQRDSAGPYLVITICTAKGSVSKKKAGDYLHYGNADFTAALLWR